MFGRYLKARALYLVAWILVLLLVDGVFALLVLPGDLIIFLSVCISVGFLLPLLVEFFRSRTFYRELQALAETPHPLEGISSLAADRRPADARMDQLSFPADIVAEALWAVRDEAHALLVDAQQDTLEYRSYIETWSHEIKTPLAAIRLVLSSSSSAKAHTCLEELQKIENYVEQALFLARSYAVSSDYAPRVQSVSSLVSAALASRKNILIARKAKIEMKLDSKNAMVLCDPKWTIFILGQIIDNACKYARPQEAPHLVFSSTHRDKGSASECVALSVTDYGIGIPAQDRERIFEKGFVGENGRNHVQAESTGIGLYLVRVLAQKMGVDVTIESQTSSGHASEPDESFTRVTLVFPQESSHRKRL